ncbi:MAG TPA: glycosyltransferase family 39 protein, partial [Nitrospirota bacterium]|nr:glycosyltransferase family 39 protein [Nitrospirota bacterium]
MHEHSAARSPETVPVLLFSFLALLTFGVQYASRGLDDNRLTSWQWVFSHTHPGMIAALIAAGCAAAYLAARSSFPDRRPLAFLILLSYGTGAVFWSEPEVIVDTARYFTQAKHLELYGVTFFLREWGGAIPAWTDLPLLPFLYGLLFSVFGESRIWIQAFTTTLFSLTVASTWLLGRTLWDEDVGFSGGLLLLGMPYLFTQVPLMLVDVGTMCFFTLAVLAVVIALRREDRSSLVAAAFAVTLALLAKYSTWMLLSALAVVFAVQWMSSRRREEGSGVRPDPRSVVVRTGLIAAGTVLLAGAVLLFFRDAVADQIRLL